MTYLYLTLSLFWFPPQLPPDDGICDLVVVECYEESKEYVLEEVRKTGLDVDYVDRLIQCESNWRQNAVGYNKNGTRDIGYWQINDIHKLSDECRFSAVCSTKWAIDKIKRDNGYGAWSCSRKI